MLSQIWRRNWEQVIPFFAYPAEIRKVIKTRGSFPSEEAAIKLLYLALEHTAKRWTQPCRIGKGLSIASPFS